MIAVKLYRRDAEALAEAGALEFFGMPVAKADGSSWIEFEANGQPCAGQVKLVPAGVATAPEIGTIADALCQNEVKGQAGRYEWVLATGPK